MSKACPQVLGIDEHFFSRKQGFAATLYDLKNHSLFDVVKGGTGENIEAYLQALAGKMLYMCEYAKGKRITIGKVGVLTAAQGPF